MLFHNTKHDITVHLFSFGSSVDIGSWSAVPYCMHKGLSANNVRVINTDISFPRLSHLYDYLVTRLNRITNKLWHSCKLSSFSCSLFGHIVTTLYISYRTFVYLSSDINLFLTYTYGTSAIPRRKSVLFCDQTYLQAQESAESHNSDVYFDKYRYSSQLNSLKNASCVFATSTATIDFLQTLDSVFVYPHVLRWLRLGLFEHKQVPTTSENKNHFSLLFIGRDKYSRGLDILLDAYSILVSIVNQPIHLNIVGFSKSEVPNSNSIPGHITFYEYLDRGNKDDFALYTRLLSEASLFVMPQRGSLLPGVIIEALFFATPVITTNVKGMTEFISNGENGLLIEKADPMMFAHVIANLLLNTKQLEEMSQKAAISVAGFSAESAANELLSVSMEIIYGSNT